MPEIVYVLTNEALEGMVKIGRTTTSVEQRIKELDNTSLPLPFQCFFAGEVSDSRMVETRLHRIFSDKRVRSNREFFQVDPNKVREAILLAATNDVTPKNDVVVDAEDVQALTKVAANIEKKSNLKFSMIDIPIGAELTFSRDTTITCQVVSDGKVNFRGEVMSPSAAALKAIRELGYSWSSVSGSDFWLYEDETLSARRQRIEEDMDII